MLSRVSSIAGRELRLHFYSASGYIVAGLFVFLTGILFYLMVFRQGQVATLRPVFSLAPFVLMLIAPAITMRTISEELRLGTYELLMTSPARLWEVVAAKFLGAMGFLIAILIPTLLFTVALEMYGRPDYGELACGYLGLILAGAAFIATGIFVSTLSDSLVLSYLVTLFFWLILLLIGALIPVGQASGWFDLPNWAVETVFRIDPSLRLRDFAIGLIDTANIVYFLSIVGVFLVASVVSLDVRRTT